MVGGPAMRVWSPTVPGVREVLHARFDDHAYPLHAHDTWTVLMVDRGAVRYALDRHEHVTDRGYLTVLPPHVAHDGRAASAGGFTKRVVYLETTALPPGLLGRSVDLPDLGDPLLRGHLDRFHRALRGGAADALAAEESLALGLEQLTLRLRPTLLPPPPDRRLARRLRELLDAHLADGVTLRAAAEELGTTPARASRSFTRHVGMAPHQYVVTRRVDRARALIVRGVPLAEAAAASGFHDQPHLTRHFRRVLGTTPGRFARSLACSDR